MTVNELRSKIRDAEFSSNKDIGNYTVCVSVAGVYTEKPNFVIDKENKVVRLGK